MHVFSYCLYSILNIFQNNLISKLIFCLNFLIFFFFLIFMNNLFYFFKIYLYSLNFLTINIFHISKLNLFTFYYIIIPIFLDFIIFFKYF